MPFTLIREYWCYEESWYKFCGVYDTREGAENARKQIIHDCYEKMSEDDYSEFIIYETDMNELVYLDYKNKATTREEREKQRIDLMKSMEKLRKK